jgi:2-oxo-4-hydroxy-4-carboxy-5-ureidoimidazoline decarboxylase
MSEQIQLAALNAADADVAREQLTRCCAATAWVDWMLYFRPYDNVGALRAAAIAAFSELKRHDWLEAFDHHPKIGDIDALRAKFASTSAWAGAEQAGTGEASEETLQALAEGNAAYEAKFGFIFIICATGKSAAEMLGALRARLPNDAETELRNAAEQQKLITELRLEKLLNPEG